MKPFQLYWDTFYNSPIIFDGHLFWEWDCDKHYFTAWGDEDMVLDSCSVLLFEIEQ